MPIIDPIFNFRSTTADYGYLIGHYKGHVDVISENNIEKMSQAVNWVLETCAFCKSYITIMMQIQNLVNGLASSIRDGKHEDYR